MINKCISFVTKIQMGNAVMNDVTDIKGLIDYAWNHAIISDQVYNGIVKNCDFKKENQTKDCTLHVSKLLEAYLDIDIYSIYSPVCLNKYQKSVSAKLVVAPHFLTRHVSYQNSEHNTELILYIYLICFFVFVGPLA